LINNVLTAPDIYRCVVQITENGFWEMKAYSSIRQDCVMSCHNFNSFYSSIAIDHCPNTRRLLYFVLSRNF